MAYGAIWWVLGPPVMMPLLRGMPVFSMDLTSVLSLMRHYARESVTATAIEKSWLRTHCY